MDLDPLVSVVIPTYNREHCIMKSVNSVLKQTYTNWELIVVDDGSADGTVDLLKSIKDERIRILINEKNMGACYSRNRGIREANGEVIAFEDSDDIWHPDKLETCLREMKAHNSDVVFSAYVLNESKIVPRFNYNECEDKDRAAILYFLMGTPTLVAKKAVLQQESFDETLPRFQDYDLFIRIHSKYSTWFIDKPLVEAYTLNDGITKNVKSGAIALARILEKNKDTIDNDPVLTSSYYKGLGTYIELAGGNGYEYFHKAKKVDNTFKMKLVCVLSKIRLYRRVYFLFYRK